LIPHSFLYFIVRAGNGVFDIATLAVFTRFLSLAEYGAYALGVTIASVASAILFQWLNAAVDRFYPMHLADPGKVIVVAARGFWVATAVAALLFLGLLPFDRVFGLSPALIVILFLTTVELGRHTLALQVANAQSAPVRYGMISWAKNGVAFTAGLIFIHYGAGEQGALLGFLAGLLFAVFTIPEKPALRLKFGSVDTSLSMDMFRYGLPMTLNFVAIVIVDVADRVMIGSLLGVTHVAPYAAAYDLVQQLIVPMMNVIFMVAFPVIVQLLEAEGDEYVRIRLCALGSKLVVFGLPVAVGLGVLSSDISGLVFGIKYRENAATLMPWLAAAIFVAGFKSYFLDVVFLLRRTTKYQVHISTLMATTNIILNLLLLPRYGVVAAAWATFAAFAVGALASWIIGRSVYSLPTFRNVFLGSAAATVTMAVAIYILPPSSGVVFLLAKIAVGIITYAMLAWVLDIAGCRALLKGLSHRQPASSNL